jgi:transposase
MRVRERKNYEPGFRDQAVALLERTDRGVGEVADSLGIPSATLRYWYKQEMARRRGKPKPKVAPPVVTPLGPPPPETLQQKLARLERENAALRKENEDLKLDKDILKKAAAFFAKESQ